MKRNGNKEKEKTGQSSPAVPTFLSRRPLLALPVQRFFSSPLASTSPRGSSETALQSDSSEFSGSASNETIASSTLHLSRTISHNRSFKLPSPAKKLPDSPASKPTIEKSCPSPNESRQTPSYRESPLSLLSLDDAIENRDELDVAELYLFIFNFLFGDEYTRKKCAADFFNSPIVVDPRISDSVKQYFYKIILQTLNPKPKQIKAKMVYQKPIYAKMLLGLSADERLLPALTETLRYLTQEMPSTKGIDVKAYIDAIANGDPPGEFPYDDIEQEKFDFLRHELQQSYDSFECIFTANDISPIGEANSFFKIQRWLYSELSYQFVLSKNRGVIERIRSELPSDDESEDENEEETQEPSKLTVTHSGLWQVLYQHLKTLLKRNKSLSFSAVKTTFLLIYQLSFELIHKRKEAELSTLFNRLIQPPTGISFLCAIKDNEKELSVEKWLNLLGNKHSFLLFRKILSILPRLNTKQVLALLDSTLMDLLIGRLSREQNLQFLHSLLELNLFVVDMRICEDSELMWIAKENSLTEILRERIWRSFSIDSLTDTSEQKGAFLKNKHLIDSGNRMQARYANSPLLKHSDVRSYHGIAAGVQISMLKEQWLDAYKTLYSLVLRYWLPSNRDLSNISRLREKWSTAMINKLALNNPYDYDAYDPQHYALEKLPAKMRVALSDREETILIYEEQIEIMKICYDNIIDCVRDRDIQLAQPYPTLVGYISFIELIKTIATEKKLNCTEKQIQSCAEKISCWFKGILEINYPDEAVFSNLIKKNFGEKSENGIFYLSLQYSPQFQELLILKKSSHSLFASSDIILSEKKTKAAIEKLLSAIIKKKSAESTNITSPSLTIFRSPPDTPKVGRAPASPYPFSSPSLSSGMD